MLDRVSFSLSDGQPDVPVQERIPDAEEDVNRMESIPESTNPKPPWWRQVVPGALTILSITASASLGLLATMMKPEGLPCPASYVIWAVFPYFLVILCAMLISSTRLLWGQCRRGKCEKRVIGRTILLGFVDAIYGLGMTFASFYSRIAVVQMGLQVSFLLVVLYSVVGQHRQVTKSERVIIILVTVAVALGTTTDFIGACADCDEKSSSEDVDLPRVNLLRHGVLICATVALTVRDILWPLVRLEQTRSGMALDASIAVYTGTSVVLQTCAALGVSVANGWDETYDNELLGAMRDALAYTPLFMVLAFAICYAWNLVNGKLDAVVLGASRGVRPLVATLFALIFLAEVPTAWQWAGSAVYGVAVAFNIVNHVQVARRSNAH